MCKACASAYSAERRRTLKTAPPTGTAKDCTRCGMRRPLEWFNVSKQQLDGLHTWCRECMKTASRKARAKTYGLTLQQLEAMEARGCHVCGTKDAGWKHGFHIDHDHECCDRVGSCGQCVRGLLCKPCNNALGFAGDSAERLRALADYLDNAKGAGHWPAPITMPE
jgi:hypothetical protein